MYRIKPIEKASRQPRPARIPIRRIITHDKNNPRSGNVMKKIGMKYCYSYEEQWQPKNFPVIFRMYQLNFDGNTDFIYKKYWNESTKHFIEQF